MIRTAASPGFRPSVRLSNLARRRRASPPPRAFRVILSGMELLPLLSRLPPGPAHPCPYLPGRTAAEIAFAADALPAGLYHQLMDCGFRRNGRVFYRPACADCRECVPIRVPTATFVAGRSQRRVMRRNADVSVRIGEPRFDEDKAALYQKYLRGHHGRADVDTDDEVERFLYHSPIDTLEFQYLVDGRLAGVGICDVCPESLSTVYFFFDPDHSRRSLGTFSALFEIEYARRAGIPHYYLGFFIRGCDRMNYKSRFRPCEVLDADGVWRTAADGP